MEQSVEVDLELIRCCIEPYRRTLSYGLTWTLHYRWGNLLGEKRRKRIRADDKHLQSAMEQRLMQTSIRQQGVKRRKKKCNTKVQQQTIQPRHSGLFVSLTGLGVLCSLHWGGVHESEGLLSARDSSGGLAVLRFLIVSE